MSDAMLRSPVRCDPYDTWSTHWGGVVIPFTENTCLTGYADGQGKAYFRIPLGCWRFDLCAISSMSRLDIVYSTLDPSSAGQTAEVVGQTGWDNITIPVYTDEWGNAYAEIALDIDEGIAGGVIGVMKCHRSAASQVPYDEHIYVTRGHANRPWLAAQMPAHTAALCPIRPVNRKWDKEQMYLYRQYTPTMAAAMDMVGNVRPHYPSPELVPFVDDGSYAWLSMQNVCGASPLCPDSDNGTAYTVYAASHIYEKEMAANSRAHNPQHIGDPIRQKKGQTRCMGLARLPVYPKRHTLGDADPPFNDTFASVEKIPSDSTMPWYLPAFVTEENGVPYAHIRVSFQNIPHTMGWKDDIQWSWTCGIHEEADPLALPELVLCADGSGTNAYAGITLEGTGGSGSSISHDPFGITIHARLSDTPELIDHACFVKCQGAYIQVRSPAANGRGERPPSEESFTPYGT